MSAPVHGLKPPLTTRQRLLRSPQFLLGLTITVVIVVLALIGPWIAPFGEREITGPPFSGATGVFGTDHLGQDVLSRLLHGGQSVLVVAFLGTLLGMIGGVALGVIAAYAGGWWDEVLMRLNDIALAFPQILLALVVLTALEPTLWLLVVLIGISHMPRIARVSRGVALGLVGREFVQSAEALGERPSRIVVAEVLPNMTTPLLAEAGLRLTYSIGLVAALGFLGFAADPGAADWGQMINENGLALTTQPWAILAPVLTIGTFTVGTNLMADSIAKLTGRVLT
ncbi:MAG: ABC transporter permease [Propionibacteriaceae bacterium]|nr:ABC transporter permease [Propionibacteriaceae bacterium]